MLKTHHLVIYLAFNLPKRLMDKNRRATVLKLDDGQLAFKIRLE